jgi:hypothetical protein
LPPLGQGRWVQDNSLNEAMPSDYGNVDYGKWYNPAANLKRARDFYGQKIGLRTNQDILNAKSAVGKAAYRKGLEAGPEAMSTGQATALAGRKIASAAGKKLGAAADYTSSVMSQGAKAFRRGMEDNPAGIGAAAIGAGLGALGLSKLLRRRRAPE